MEISRLIRDKLAGQISRQAPNLKIETLSEREFHKALKAKLQEEVRNYLANPGLKTLVEIQILLEELAVLEGSSPEQFKAAKDQLIQEEGGYGLRQTLVEEEDVYDSEILAAFKPSPPPAFLEGRPKPPPSLEEALEEGASESEARPGDLPPAAPAAPEQGIEDATVVETKKLDS